MPGGSVTTLHVLDGEQAFELLDVGPEARATVRALNVVATGANTDGFLVFFPCGSPQPATSTMNFAKGGTIAHLSLVPVALDHTVCMYASATVHLVIDDQAWFMTADQPLQTAVATGHYQGCGGYARTRTTFQQTIPDKYPGPVTLTNFFDIVGGVAPYDVTINAPAGWTTSATSNSSDDYTGNLHTEWSNSSGLMTPADITVTIKDDDGATNVITFHYTATQDGHIVC